jgi:hypothetical protein
MRKAYAAGGMIVRSATRGGGNSGGSSSGNGKGGNSSKQADEPNNGSAAVANAGGGNSPANKSPAPETSPVVVTKADPALLAAIKNGRIRGRNHQGNPQQQQQQQRHHHHHNQPPPDVMNLTAKNYRLAKELVSPILHGCNGLIRITRGSLRSHARRVLLLCLFLLCFLA